MKHNLILGFLLLIFSFRITAQTKTTVAQDTLIATGKLIKKPMITKGGKPSSYINDFFFETGKDNYFIKVREGKVMTDTLDKYVGNTITFSYILIKRGEWDSDGKEIVQSRVGEYIRVLGIKRK